MKRIIVTLTAAALLSLSACGGEGPGTDEIANALFADGDNGLTPAQSDCLAGLYEDSDQSGKELQTMVDELEAGDPMVPGVIFEGLPLDKCLA